MKTIPLTQDKTTFVDDGDFNYLQQWKWRLSAARGRAYAVRRRCRADGPGTETIRMHRIILNAPSVLEVDHVNGNGLDNRRGNLRLATHLLNQRNICRRKPRACGLPRGIRRHGRGFEPRLRGAGYLGTFDTIDQAQAAYQKANNANIAEAEGTVRRVLASLRAEEKGSEKP